MQAIVSINESGTEAAAATALEIMITSVLGGPSPYQLTFDRPFVMTLSMAQGSVPLFIGVVDSPTTADSK
jgi:serpin B